MPFFLHFLDFLHDSEFFPRNRLVALKTRQATHAFCANFLGFTQTLSSSKDWPSSDASSLFILVFLVVWVTIDPLDDMILMIFV